MSEQLVSIIVPIYNSELYLSKCLESILEQTYQKLEIILINDGSSDSSGLIIEKYSEKENRVITIQKENGGIGSAYKAAFEVMTGDFVLFVDSDDWLELNAVENLLNLAKENEADMVSFGIRPFNKTGEEIILNSFKNIDLLNSSNKEILETHFKVLKHPTLVRFYKRELFNEIVIFEQNIGIDEMLTPQLLVKCHRAVYTSKVYYNILIRQDSVCRTEYNEKKIEETMKAYRFLLSFMEDKISHYKYIIEVKYFGVINGIYNYAILNEGKIPNKKVSEIRNEIRYLLKGIKKSILWKEEKVLQKLGYYVAVNIPFLYNTFLRTYYKLDISRKN